jgi:hypothetical protein
VLPLAEAIDALVEANAALRKRRALAKPERTLAAAMHTAFRAQERAFLARLALIRGRFSPAPLREAILDLPWEPLFDEAAQATVQAFAAPLDAAAAQALSSGMLAAVADLSIEGSFGLEHPAAVDYLARRGAERVGQITNTTRTRLRSLLGQAADEGWSYDRTAREIRKQYAGFSATRARNIAVYELGDAYEHGNVLVARDLQDGGLAMEKSWLTVGDDRVRPDHRANQGQGWIPLDDTFGSGDDRPPADPGCRCTLLMRRRPDERSADALPPATPPRPPSRPVADAFTLPPPPSSLQRTAMSVRGDIDVRAVAEDSLRAIAAVHEDGQLPRIPVDAKFDQFSRVAGVFRFNGAGEPIEIAVDQQRKWALTVHETFVHETGHFLDLSGIGTPGKFASYDDPILDGWRSAVRSSRAVTQLQDELASGVRRVTMPDGTVREYPVDTKYLGYLTDNSEVWARSYAQYIATRSGHETLLRGIEEARQGSMYPAQWADDDFEPIALAIDEAFRQMGWIP